MTFQEFLTKNPLNQVLNNELLIYQLMGEDILDSKWVEAVGNKLTYILAPLDEFELLYTEKVTASMIQSIISGKFFSLYSKFVNYTVMINKKWTDDSNYNETVDTGVNSTEGYTGFNVTNQDGDYRKVTNTGNTKSSNKLGYLQFFNQALDEWGTDIYREIRNKVLRVIY